MPEPTAWDDNEETRVCAATVAVCTRNRQETIEACLASVVAQDFPKERFEVVIIDDGSSDGTPDIARRFVSDAPPIVRYIRQPHGGLSAARNRAVTEGRGDLICFLDDDAEAVPGWLGAIQAGAESHPDVDCFAGRIRLRLESKAPRTCDRESLAAELDEDSPQHPVTWAKGANMAMRKSAFRHVGLFNPALVWRGDEVDWQRRLKEAGGKLRYLPDALVWHRRLERDLRWTRLLKTRFGWGIGQVQYRREAGEALVYSHELRIIFFALLHAIRRRCPGGLLKAVTHVGAVWAGLRGELHKPRTIAPTLPEESERV